MRVQAVPSDESGCGLYRTYLPTLALGGEVDVTVHPHLNVEYDGGRVVDAWPAVDGADVVWVHRPMSRLLVEALACLQCRGVAVVVDIDDDLTVIPKGIPSWDPAQPHRNAEENWRWFTVAARQADVVICSTPALMRRYGEHGRAAVIENCVPAEWLAAGRVENGRLTVGWSGSPSHHPYDLEQVQVLPEVLADTGARFHTIGSADTLSRLGVEGTWEPWVAVWDYPDRLRQFDVGIVPLADSQFNRAKSWIKGLELAAFGVPFVASPTPEYRRLGAGLLAKRPRDWRRLLTGLLTDAELRAEVAGVGREVAGRWTVEAHRHRWVEAFERGLDNRRSRHGHV